MQLFNKILSTLKISTKSPWGGISSSRVSSFFLLSVIMLSVLVFLGIEISVAVSSLIHTGTYVISNESIIIFTLLLSHHLSLLGISKSNETKQLNNESKGVAKTPDVPPTEPIKESTEQP